MSIQNHPFIAHFDGAARNNPGPAGAGCVIFGENGEILWKRAVSLVRATNNEAEYNALILTLEKLEKEGLSNVLVRGDSKLVVEQASGRWRVNKPGLISLAARAKNLLAKTGASLEWVPRTKNAVADEMSNRAIDEGDFEQFFERENGRCVETAEKFDVRDSSAGPNAKQSGPVVADYFPGADIFRKVLRDIEAEECPPSSKILKESVVADIRTLADFTAEHPETGVKDVPDGSIPRYSSLFYLADSVARLFESMGIACSTLPLNLAFCAGRLSEALENGNIPPEKFALGTLEWEVDDHETKTIRRNLVCSGKE